MCPPGVLQFSCTGYTEAPPSAKSGKSMTVNITNRSHYIVGLLLLAVALTTALVLAAEQDSRSHKQALRQTILTGSHSLPQGPMGWECI